MLNIIKKIEQKWQYWSVARHILCVFLGDSSGDILISLETFKCQDSFLSAPFGMMLLWLGRWQLNQLCIRWEYVEGIYANQVHFMDGSKINENAHFKVLGSCKFLPVRHQKSLWTTTEEETLKAWLTLPAHISNTNYFYVSWTLIISILKDN